MSDVAKVKEKHNYIDLDKRRELVYDLNSFAEMEDRYGSVDAALKLMEEANMHAIRFILWAGLIHDDETLTEKQVGRLITIQDLDRLSKVMDEAMSDNLPDRPEDAIPNE